MMMLLELFVPQGRLFFASGPLNRKQKEFPTLYALCVLERTRA
jgi:hypothetical protein